MKWGEREKGAITVYLSIVFLVIAALIGTMVDGARIRLAEAELDRSVKIAANSVLAGYYSPLKEEYGIFSLSTNNPDQLKDLVRDYVSKNLMVDLNGEGTDADGQLYSYLKESIFGEERYKGVKYFNPFGFQVENISVEPMYNLTENGVLKNQITQFMKYRAPKEIASNLGLLKKMGNTATVSNSRAALKGQISLGARLAVLGKKQGELKSRMDEVQRRISKGVLDLPVDRYIRDVETYCSLSGYLAKQDLLQKLEKIPDPSDYIDRQIQILRETLAYGLHEKQKEALGPVRDHLNRAVEANTLAETCAQELVALKEMLKVEVLKEKPKLVKKGGEYLYNDLKIEKGTYNAFSEDIEAFETALHEDNAEVLLSKNVFGRNSSLLRSSLQNFEEVNEKIWPMFKSYPYLGEAQNDPTGVKSLQEDFDRWVEKEIRSTEDQLLSGYDNTLYSYIKTARSPQNSSRDRRNEAEKKKQDVLSSERRKNYRTIDEKSYGELNTLPSFGGKAAGTGSAANSSEEDSPGNMEANVSVNLGKSGQYNEWDGKDTLEDGGLLQNIAQGLEKVLVSMRDEVYVNEYAVGMFSSSVGKSLKTDGTIVADTSFDLRNNKKGETKKNFFFENEVEYIIWGKTSEAENNQWLKTSIYTIRFVSNTVYIHTDRAKVVQANEIAMAIAAATMGASAALIPVIRELILCGWAALEAAEDLSDILKGNLIPFYKDSQSWITGDTGLGAAALKHGENLPAALSYHDYLRLLLLATSPSKKMDRIADLMQLNMRERGRANFLLSDYHTHLHLQSEATLRYWFLTAFLIPEGRIVKGRHKLNNVYYQGY